MTRPHFGDALTAAMRHKQSQVVVGLDPRPERLPDELRPADGAFGDAPAAAEAIKAFNEAVVEQVAEFAVAVKPQVAFYEQLGCAGMEAYAHAIAVARAHGLMVIGDAKRNDIASTAAAYAAAHLGGADAPFASDFVADAVTINPYLGSDGVRPFLETAAATGRGVFALVKTSNRSSAELQDLDCGGAPLYEQVADLVEEWGAAYRGHEGYSCLGAVVGATYPEELVRLRGLMPHTLLLVPGFGAQGGDLDSVKGAFDADGLGAVVNSSRGIIFAWEQAPYDQAYGPGRWRDAIRAAAADMRGILWDATH
jgi:orotidine-5'-phosphate decarboxylase